MTTTDYGPQTEQILALLERCRTLTETEALELEAGYSETYMDGWSQARDAVYEVATDASFSASLAAAEIASSCTSYGWMPSWAALCLGVRDLLGTDEYDVISRRWRTVIGPLHPDDPEAKLEAAALLAWQGIARANPDWTLAEVAEAARLVMA